MPRMEGALTCEGDVSLAYPMSILLGSKHALCSAKKALGKVLCVLSYAIMAKIASDIYVKIA